ncbi:MULTISPECIES: DUF2145 domain-containing protein [unclassified Roseateles]|uniref:DUF2145 domain-containing protein n=1 Tax=unclassified Roseateles TaxID=2626991 RepID=UPI0006FBBC2B|nr:MULTISPECIES: DUF2145 domain-containing protein [unclassified Roseateles]KQW45502.1 hypothetical protein ASC81_11370 [Pelomonas sp. Root405]KRA72346.1 hypothetical protein ASD88_11370 [Pelomonas sp. Root662]
MRRSVAALLLAAAAGAQAGSLPQGCDRPVSITATQQDRLLRFAAVIREALAASGAQAALIARSGTDLSRFGLRYSHSAVALADGLGTPWAVRQLYYACAEGQARLFDQGLAGFVTGSDDAEIGYVSLLLLPPEAAGPLAAAALDKSVALGLLNARYSANAYPFSTRYQNCNQWVAELIAASATGLAARADTQAWLQREGYAPVPVQASPWLMLAGRFVPWLHFDDHPPEQLGAGAVQTSLPASVETFALQRWPTARRLEFCHGPQGVVQREGGAPLAAGCQPQPGDRITSLD